MIMQIEEEISGLEKFIVNQDKFNGPFDILLNLIDEKQISLGEISLHNIITDYLAFIRSMDKIDILLSSEFLVMAAYLIEMKSRLLLPAEESIQEEAEIGDIEISLLEHLSQYKVFKDAAWQLRERKNIFGKVYSRYRLGFSENDRPRDIFLVDLSIRDLVIAFQKVWDNVIDSGDKEIIDEPVTVKERIEEILKKVKENPAGVAFQDLFVKRTRIEAIVTFLAMLELICRKMVRFLQEDNFGGITIYYTGAEIENAG